MNSVIAMRPDGAFDGIVVELDAAVVEESAEGWPAGEGVADRLGKGAAAGDATKFRLEPRLHCGDERSGVDVARTRCRSSAVLAADGLLDCVEFGDAAQRFGGDRRAGRLMQVVKLPRARVPNRLRARCRRRVVSRSKPA